MSETEPDSAMASGSDAGEPGEHGDRRPLRPDERALLDDLGQAEGNDVAEFAEESEAAGHAADDEAPLPAEGGPQDDGLAPRFTAPEG
jgi:hypothetical protein